jgi:hypothetical protein
MESKVGSTQTYVTELKEYSWKVQPGPKSRKSAWNKTWFQSWNSPESTRKCTPVTAFCQNPYPVPQHGHTLKRNKTRIVSRVCMQSLSSLRHLWAIVFKNTGVSPYNLASVTSHEYLTTNARVGGQNPLSDTVKKYQTSHCTPSWYLDSNSGSCLFI